MAAWAAAETITADAAVVVAAAVDLLLAAIAAASGFCFFCASAAAVWAAAETTVVVDATMAVDATTAVAADAELLAAKQHSTKLGVWFLPDAQFNFQALLQFFLFIIQLYKKVPILFLKNHRIPNLFILFFLCMIL